MKNSSLLTLFSSLALLVASPWTPQAHADVIAAFDLNGITGGQYDTGTQYQTGLSIKYNASLTGWTFSGFHAIHAVQVTQDNWALMVFAGGSPADANVYTLNTGFSCNTLGTQYFVSYDIAPTVYVNGDQATRATDALQISVLNPQGQVVASHDAAPGAWQGSETFQKAYFSYFGDGTGDVRLQITTAQPGNNYFAGAVDNIAFESSVPVVPEPSTWVLALGGIGLLGGAQSLRRVFLS